MADNIISNHDFVVQPLQHHWQATSGQGYVASPELGNYLEGVLADTPGGNYAVVTNRVQYWQGLEQDITNNISAGVNYRITACVRVHGGSLTAEDRAKVEATLRLENSSNSTTEYKLIGRTTVSTQEWVNLVGSFILETRPDRVVFYLEGPPPGVDLLVDYVVISPWEL